MAKRILITSTDAMMKQFLEPHVKNLLAHGYEVEIACSEVLDRFREVREDLGSLIPVHHLSLQRSPLAVSAHRKGYRELKEIIRTGGFDLIWTNEPVMSVVTRLAAQEAREKGTTVMYMVHGFHFFRGAPALNWMLYYPIERLMAPMADLICTINREDHARAQKLPVKAVAYIHGVGIDTGRLHTTGQTDIRKELDLPENAFLVLSVGELNKNKNQKVILKALAELQDPDIHYLLCGKGDQQDALEKLASVLGLADRTHFLGYRMDVVDICSQADVFAMPSRREGLPVASLEAMFSGLPIVNSNIRGLSDVTENGKTGYVYAWDDVHGFAEGIRRLKDDPEARRRIRAYNPQSIRPYYLENAEKEVLALIERVTSSSKG